MSNMGISDNSSAFLYYLRLYYVSLEEILVLANLGLKLSCITN